jgi:PAS domain S-box-containing protein
LNSVNNKPYTILTVDDDAGIRGFLEIFLNSLNYHVIAVENGRRGMEFIRKDLPDAVITDLHMPGGDGFDLLAYIRESAPDLPVIVMASQGQLDDAVRALRLGAWDYIHKPIKETAILRLAIEKALEKARLVSGNRNDRNHPQVQLFRKSAELRASDRHYRLVADFAYGWECWINADGKILYTSPSSENVTGFSSEEFVRDPGLIQEIIHEDDRALFAQHLKENRLMDGVCRIDFRIVRRDGRERWIGHCCQEIRGSNGDYLGRRCSNRDITYQKKIERDLIRHQQELLNKTDNLEKVNKALKALLDQREVEKQAIEQTMVSNLKRFVFPYIEELEKLDIEEGSKIYTGIIRTNIEQLISPISKTLSGAYFDLTPTEIKVADLIRQGGSTKSIATLMNTSVNTVAIHRNKIRKKLNLLNKKVNLYTFLNSLP